MWTGSVLWINSFEESTFSPKKQTAHRPGFLFSIFSSWAIMHSTQGMTQIWQLEVSQQSRSIYILRTSFCSSNLQELSIQTWQLLTLFSPKKIATVTHFFQKKKTLLTYCTLFYNFGSPCRKRNFAKGKTLVRIGILGCRNLALLNECYVDEW